MKAIVTPIDSNSISRIITDWKDQLERQYLAINELEPTAMRAYVCSPCSAATPEEAKRNVQAARFYMWYAYENMGLIARAPHAYLPILLSDRIPGERALALRFGLDLLEQSELMLACGKLLTSGMSGEVTKAASLKMPITVFDADLYLKIRKLVTRTGGNKDLVTLHREPCFLALTAEELLGEGERYAV